MCCLRGSAPRSPHSWHAHWRPRRAMPASRWAWGNCRRWTTSLNSNGGSHGARPTTASRPWSRPRSDRSPSRVQCARRWSPRGPPPARRAGAPPLEPLGRLLAHSYQLLAQLTAVKTTLLLRRGRLKPGQIRAPLMQAAETIETTLIGQPAALTAAPRADASPGPVVLPDPFEDDLSPWVLRRLDLAAAIAVQLRDDACQVLRALAT